MRFYLLSVVRQLGFKLRRNVGDENSMIAFIAQFQYVPYPMNFRDQC